MSESFASRLALAEEQLNLTAERVRDHDALLDDLPAVAAYLDELTQHAYAVCEWVLRAVDRVQPGHPVRLSQHGIDVQASFANARDLFNIAQHFAAEARSAVTAMNEGEAR